jgi:flagellar basal body P-ring formation protein FlgA
MRYPLNSLVLRACSVALIGTLPGTRAYARNVSVAALVEDAARTELLTRARQSGLANPSIQVDVRTPSGKTAAPCPQPVIVEALDTRFITRMRFTATCPADPNGHTAYIVRGAVEADVVVAASAINAGEDISPEQLELARRDVSMTPGALSDINLVAGKSIQRALHRGQLIDKRWLVEPLLVKRGAGVNIIARNGGIDVEVRGEAMEDGRRDAVIRVRNTLNGNVIRARVVGDGTVEPADMPAR